MHLVKNTWYAILLFAGSVCSVGVQAQDTVQRRSLQGVRIVASSPKPSETKSQTPVQVIGHQELERMNAFQLSDAVQHFSGVTVKDYGGVGGIKTISARGLGSQFSTLAIDGFAVGDCQNGQPDLGRFIIDNVDYLSFSNGQPDDILQPARILASSNVLDMKTGKPDKSNLKLAFEAGSFGLLHPSVAWEWKITPKLSLSLKGTYMQSDGDYPFTIYYTNSKKDSSSRANRHHSDMYMANVEANLFYDIAPTRGLSAKLHYYNAFHNLPGPVIFYTEKGSEWTKDHSCFLQMQYLDRSLDNLEFQLKGKAYRTKNVYEDTAYRNSAGFLHNEFEQGEYYFSASAKYGFLEHFSIGYSSDYIYNSLVSNIETSSEVERHSWLNALSANASWEKVSMTGTVLSDLVSENVCGSFAKDYRHFGHYFGITYKPLNDNGLRLRYFIKETYRIPNFNECYYTSLSRDLNPENALQNNLGLTFFHNYFTNVSFINDMTVTLDGYYNRVKDKIVAIPRQSLYLWSMQNIGEVSVLGFDATMEVNTISVNKLKLSLSANYSFLRALDVTDPSSKTYRQQIPYTPRHSAGASFFLTSGIVDFGYNLVFVGDRYRLAQNTENNLVGSYVDQSIILSKSMDFKFGTIKIQFQVLNIFDVQYEVIKSYPMMGRNYKLNVTYKF